MEDGKDKRDEEKEDERDDEEVDREEADNDEEDSGPTREPLAHFIDNVPSDTPWESLHVIWPRPNMHCELTMGNLKAKYLRPYGPDNYVYSDWWPGDKPFIENLINNVTRVYHRSEIYFILHFGEQISEPHPPPHNVIRYGDWVPQ